MVFDVDQLKEAVEAYDEWGLPGFIEFAQDNYNATVTLFAAARLVVAGQPLPVCENHGYPRAGGIEDVCLIAYFPLYDPDDDGSCRMVEWWGMPTGGGE